MKPTQTGIAVALALVVVTVFFVFPGLSPFGVIGSDSPSDQTAAADDALTTDNQATTTMSLTTVNKLEVTDTVVGTGAVAAAGDSITVNYVGALTNGAVFDASANHGTAGFTFTLGTGQVIQGWDEGIVGMKVGGKRRLVIPSSLAYGDQEVGGVIPAGATLVFDVELLKVEKGAQ